MPVLVGSPAVGEELRAKLVQLRESCTIPAAHTETVSSPYRGCFSPAFPGQDCQRDVCCTCGSSTALDPGAAFEVVFALFLETRRLKQRRNDQLECVTCWEALGCCFHGLIVAGWRYPVAGRCLNQISGARCARAASLRGLEG